MSGDKVPAIVTAERPEVRDARPMLEAEDRPFYEH
jgi:hypothetical protein